MIMKDQDPREKGTRNIWASILHVTSHEEPVGFYTVHREAEKSAVVERLKVWAGISVIP